MFAKLSAARRHTRLMKVALHLVCEADLNLDKKPEDVTAVEVSTLAFGRHQLRVQEEEAGDYLAAALVARGHGIDHLPALPSISA